MAPVTESAELVVDPQLAAAVELAREVLAQDIPNDAIGEHLEVVAEAELVATHLFACNNPGYVGWRWAVNVTRVPDSDVVTRRSCSPATDPCSRRSGCHGMSA